VANSLLAGKKAGNFRGIGRFSAKSSRKHLRTQWFVRNSLRRAQGIISRAQGIFPAFRPEQGISRKTGPLLIRRKKINNNRVVLIFGNEIVCFSGPAERGCAAM
jgi:hypothetical protein